jgi:hypothetical protein
MPETLKPLPLHNPRKPKGVDPGSVIAVGLLLTFSLFPRLWIVAYWIFGNSLDHAYSSWIIPVIGFFILPWTTVVYAWMWAISSDAVTGWEWLPVAVAFVLDASFWVAARRLAR